MAAGVAFDDPAVGAIVGRGKGLDMVRMSGGSSEFGYLVKR